MDELKKLAERHIYLLKQVSCDIHHTTQKMRLAAFIEDWTDIVCRPESYDLKAEADLLRAENEELEEIISGDMASGYQHFQD